MKIGAAATLIALFALTLLGGCPKSNNMLDHSKKPNVIPKEGAAPPGELTTGTAPAGATAPPAGDSGSTGGSDTGGGDTGGDTGGDDEGGG